MSEAEAAFLAGLPRNPRKLNPHAFRDAADKRQRVVLRRMHENSALDDERYENALNEPLRLRPPRRLFRAPHFTDLVLQAVAGDAVPGGSVAKHALDQPGTASPATVRTTLDLALNDEVERVLRERLVQLREHNVRNAAAVVIENATGDVIALVGSENYLAPGSRPGEWRVGEAFGGLDLKTVHVSARARARRDAGDDDRRCAHELRDGERFLPARELQPPLLWTGAISHGARQLA